MRRELLICCLAVLFSCTSPEQPPRHESLSIALEEDPGTLDPHEAASVVEVSLCKNLYEGLYRLGTDGQLQPGLAESVSLSEDGKRYTFRLRKACWSNGEPLTADAFVCSWRRALEPGKPTRLHALLYPVRHAALAKKGLVGLEQIGVHAPDESTLVVDLEHPLPYFLRLTTHPLLAALHPDDASVSSGPFTLESWRPQNQIVLQRNPSYWRAQEVPLHRLLFMVLPDATCALRIFEEGALDFVGSPLGSLPTEALANLSLRTLPSEATFWYKFNTRLSPLNHVKVRKALSLSIDRAALIAKIARAPHVPSCGPIPPSMGLTPPVGEGYQPERARTLLEEARQEIGPLPPLRLLVSPKEPYRQIAQAIQDQWRKTLQIDVTVQIVELKTLIHRMVTGDYQIASNVWVADVSDPSDFLLQFVDNETGWEHPEFARLMREAQTETNAKRRQELLTEAQQLFVEECPACCIFHPCFSYVISEQVASAFPPSSTLDFSWSQKIE